MRNYLCFAIFAAVVLHPGTSRAQATPSIAQVMNAASLTTDTSNVAAPGSLITIFGSNLATASQAAPTNQATLPLNLNGTVVLVGGIFAPLLAVSPSQVNAQIPFETSPGIQPLVVFVNGHTSSSIALPVQPAAPGVFTLSGNGAGDAEAFHAADSSPVTESSPATAGEQIMILMTGLGATVGSAVGPPLATGRSGSGQPTLNAPTVTIGGQGAAVASAVASGIGTYAVEVTVPNAGSGDQALVVNIAGTQTNAPVTIPMFTPAPPSAGTTGGIGGTSSGVVGGPAIFAGGILNAASLDPASTDLAAPGELISIFGTNLSTTTTGNSSAPLPTSLAGVSVTIGGISAPVLLVSPSQINAQVPYEIQPGSTINVAVAVNGVPSAPEPLKVASAAPGIFTASANGLGIATAYHADGTAINSSSPALPNEQITILADGLGATISNSILPAVVTGQAGNGQLTITTPTVTVGTTSALVTSAVAAPGQVGTYIVSAQLPDVPAGDEPITVAAAGNTSRASLIRIGSLFPHPPVFSQANLAGSFNATFAMTVANPDDPTKTEVAVFSKSVASPGCTIEVAGTNGPTYTGLVHCQDYSDPNNLVAVIVGLKDGQFADNKLVFTTILDTGINHFFYVGNGVAPSGPISLSADAAITSAAVSIDLKRPNFAVGDTVVGTINVGLALSGSSTVPSQTVGLGGGFSDQITFVSR